MKHYRLVIREVDRHVFDEIVSGQKSIETRAATKKYKAIAPGDRLTFVCESDTITKTVAKTAHYRSLEALYDQLPLARILPAAKDVPEAISIHLSFPGYKEKLETHGIMAFELC